MNLIAVGRALTGTMHKKHDEDTDTLIVAETLNAGGNDGGFRTEPGAHLIAFQCHGTNVGEMGTLRGGDGGLTSGVPFIAHTLKAEGSDASEDGTGRGTPLIAFDPTAGRDERIYEDGTSPPLKVGTTLPQMPWAPAVAFREDQRTGDCFETTVPSGIAVGGGKPGQGYPAIREGMAVRRLTPTECERLQGFPDGWTCLCRPLEDWARDPEDAAERCSCPDSPRYRQMGNAVTVPVVEWIGRRLKAALSSPSARAGRKED